MSQDTQKKLDNSILLNNYIELVDDGIGEEIKYKFVFTQDFADNIRNNKTKYMFKVFVLTSSLVNSQYEGDLTKINDRNIKTNYIKTIRGSNYIKSSIRTMTGEQVEQYFLRNGSNNVMDSTSNNYLNNIINEMLKEDTNDLSEYDVIDYMYIADRADSSFSAENGIPIVKNLPKFNVALTEENNTVEIKKISDGQLLDVGESTVGNYLSNFNNNFIYLANIENIEKSTDFVITTDGDKYIIDSIKPYGKLNLKNYEFMYVNLEEAVYQYNSEEEPLKTIYEEQLTRIKESDQRIYYYEVMDYTKLNNITENDNKNLYVYDRYNRKLFSIMLDKTEIREQSKISLNTELELAKEGKSFTEGKLGMVTLNYTNKELLLDKKDEIEVKLYRRDLMFLPNSSGGGNIYVNEIGRSVQELNYPIVKLEEMEEEANYNVFKLGVPIALMEYPAIDNDTIKTEQDYFNNVTKDDIADISINMFMLVVTNKTKGISSFNIFTLKHTKEHGNNKTKVSLTSSGINDEVFTTTDKEEVEQLKQNLLELQSKQDKEVEEVEEVKLQKENNPTKLTYEDNGNGWYTLSDGRKVRGMKNLKEVLGDEAN